MNKFVAAGLLILGTSISLLATAPSAPEIDPASGASALALLGAAAIMIRGRFKK